MVSKKSGLVITGLGVLSFLFSLVYTTSCTRPIEDDPWACNYVYCMNGGKCDSAKCKCPTGYEGADCGIATAAKFEGFWKTRAYVLGSDSANLVGTSTYYTLDLRTTASNTTFFLHNFDGNAYYNHIICKIDSTDKNHFRFDTTSVLNMYYDHFRIRAGWGNYYVKEDSIMAMVYLRRLNSTVNWQNDTILLYAKKL